MTNETVTISRDEYDELIDQYHWLCCLEAAGVANWEGFDVARRIYQEENDE